jgi:glycine/D-amino acid oxidase-like deaminating enzyme
VAKPSPFSHHAAAMSESLFAANYQDKPYWWEAVPRPELPPVAPPARADVAIIGSGYTGLCAAIELARGGRQVVVLDAQDAGWGCSTRNGGQVSTSIKPGLDDLEPVHGRDIGFRIRREGINALSWIGDFIEREKIDCDWERVGRFHAAHNAAAFETLARAVTQQPKGLEVEVFVVPREDQRREIGSDRYFGGVVYPAHASLHPGKYHKGLLERALAAGAQVISHCPVLSIQRESDGFRLTSPRGTLQVRDVLVATNGYTGPLTPWLRRRVIPIGSYIIATEMLDPVLARRLVPNNRVLSDTRKLVFYYRLSEDRRRVLFGGRVALKENNPRVSAPRLHAHMTRIFPELAATKITHSWMGFVAYTFDTLPHLGRQEDGIYYCMGYCGSGVSLASYFGTRIGQQILGRAEGRTALDGIMFQTRPLYNGDPWFLTAAVAYYKLRDRLNL